MFCVKRIICCHYGSFNATTIRTTYYFRNRCNFVVAYCVYLLVIIIKQPINNRCDTLISNQLFRYTYNFSLCLVFTIRLHLLYARAIVVF